MTGLRRLEGAKEVFQDEYQAGKSQFTVTYPAVPAAKPSVVKKEILPYTLDQVRAKITVTLAEADGVRRAGPYVLAKGEEDPAKLEVGKKYTVRGELKEDEKGVVTLTLDRVDAVAQ
jgi:hypothetical protein